LEVNERTGLLKVKRISDGSICSLKKMDIPKESQVEALNKIRLMASVYNEHLISYKESFYDEINGHLCIAMELVELPDLSLMIRDALN
jgi:serine/threonine protein kinase